MPKYDRLCNFPMYRGISVHHEHLCCLFKVDNVGEVDQAEWALACVRSLMRVLRIELEWTIFLMRVLQEENWTRIELNWTRIELNWTRLSSCVLQENWTKNTIRDEGSNAIQTADSVDTVDAADQGCINCGILVSLSPKVSSTTNSHVNNVVRHVKNKKNSCQQTSSQHITSYKKNVNWCDIS